MPEYQNMKRLDPWVLSPWAFTAIDNNPQSFSNRLSDWCQSRIRTPLGYDLLRQLFSYDPDSRLTAKEALQHKWFHEDPKPTWKSVICSYPWYPVYLTNNVRHSTAHFRASLLTRFLHTGVLRRMRLHPWCLPRRTRRIKVDMVRLEALLFHKLNPNPEVQPVSLVLVAAARTARGRVATEHTTRVGRRRDCISCSAVHCWFRTWWLQMN